MVHVEGACADVLVEHVCGVVHKWVMVHDLVGGEGRGLGGRDGGQKRGQGSEEL